MTEGSTAAITKPETVSVFVRVAKGTWQPVVIAVGAHAATAASETEMKIELGTIEIPEHITPYVGGG